MLKEGGGLTNDELYDVFDNWNRGELQSYLIEITRDIFSVKDDQGGDGYLVDKILDVAGAKGTGKWMSQLALDLGVPSTMVTEAVYARAMSAMKEARVHAAKILKGPGPANAVLTGMPVVEFTSALAYYDSYRRERLPANLLQAQRDYFGAHTYQRIDRPLDKKFHSEWLDLRRQPKD